MRHLILEITAAERHLLDKTLRTHPKAYMRERAYALLEVSTGQLIEEVAAKLPIKRQARTVSTWVKAYQRGGLDGLIIAPGSGRKAAFFPLDPSGGAPKGRAKHRAPKRAAP